MRGKDDFYNCPCPQKKLQLVLTYRKNQYILTSQQIRYGNGPLNYPAGKPAVRLPGNESAKMKLSLYLHNPLSGAIPPAAAILLPLLLLLLAALACASAAPPAAPPTEGATTAAPATTPAAAASADPPTKKAVVVALTANVIVPAYEQAAARMGDLAAAADALCAAPNPAALTAARQAWREARAAWSFTAPMRFGPVMTRKSLGLVDWPAAPAAEIDMALAARESITLNDIREFLPSDRRGLGVMEYLLFGADEAILMALADPATLRCDYLTALSQAAAAEVDAARLEWTQGAGDGGPYRAVFDGSAASSLHESAALTDLVSAIVFLNQRIARMQLAPALGMDGVTPDPSSIPGGPAHNAVADMQSQVRAMQAIYSGGDRAEALGLRHLTAQLSPEIDRQTAAALESASAAIAALDEPLLETILSDPAPGQAAFDRIIAVQRLFNADIASLLNISIGFSDQDGDS